MTPMKGMIENKRKINIKGLFSIYKRPAVALLKDLLVLRRLA